MIVIMIVIMYIQSLESSNFVGLLYVVDKLLALVI